MEEWKYREELSNSLAVGYIQDACETCRLYDAPLTVSMCDCFVKASEELLLAQYRNAMQMHAQGFPGAPRIPLSIRQQGTLGVNKVMPQIQVLVEQARLEDERKRIEMTEKREKYGNTYTQNITQHGGVMNASQTGDVSAQQLTVGDFDNLRRALVAMRVFFKGQDESVDSDEVIGLLASAEKAASAKDESGMLDSLKRVPAKAWEIGRIVIPQVLLHYLQARGLA
jgi:hypothetical protein